MFKAATEGNVTRLEMSPDVLDMALKITSYIHENFLESDFFTLGNTKQADLDQFFELLKDAKSISEDGPVSLEMEREQYWILRSVIWYGSNFGADIQELEEFHDHICDISDEVDIYPL